MRARDGLHCPTLSPGGAGLGKRLAVLSLALLAGLAPDGARCAPVDATGTAPVFSTWNRPIEADTAATAWLIRRFVAASAVFVFEPTGTLRMPGTAFDTPSAEDSRRGNHTVVEFWARKQKLHDPALERLLVVVHDIEINLWQPKATAEAAGLAAVFRGLNEMEPRRTECLEKGIEIIEALYRDFARQTHTTSPAK